MTTVPATSANPRTAYRVPRTSVAASTIATLHAARPGDVSPLHQHGSIGERRAEAEPREAPVAQMANQPFERRPGDRQRDPERHPGSGQADTHDEPEHRG